jgi:hypothetical protein
LTACERTNPPAPFRLPVTRTRKAPAVISRQESVTEPLSATVVGLKIQVSPVPLTTAEKLIVPVRPLIAVTVMVELPLPPTEEIVTGFGLAAIEKSPDTVTLIGAVELVIALLLPPAPVIMTL